VNFHLQSSHLEHLNRELALLVEQIDVCCSSTIDPSERRQLELSAALAHDLLDKMMLAEQAIATSGEASEFVAALEKRLLDGDRRIDELRARVGRDEAHPEPRANDPRSAPPRPGACATDS
jgi:hypothetical protein